MRTPRLAAAVLSLTAAAATTGVTAAVPATAEPAPAPAEPVVTGFALGSLPGPVLARDAGALDTVSVAAVSLTPSGGDLTPPTRDMRAVRSRAAGLGLDTELLLSNYSNDLGAFDPRAARRLLRSPALIARVAERVAAVVEDGGWGGVNIDLELVEAEDADGLTALARAVGEALPPGRTLSIDVSARTSRAAYEAEGYDLTALGEVVDVVVLMTYDYSGPTWSDPGPIGPVEWQRRAVAAAAEQVGADQLDLGIAGYGYTWPTTGTGRTVNVGQARRMVERDGARARWHGDSLEWSARLSDGTQIWWSDARSYDARVALATELGMHGVAVWRLGSADPLG